MQNKANFRKVKFDVTEVLTKNYDQLDTWSIRKTKPIKANSKPIKANPKPIQSQYRPNLSRRSLWRSRKQTQFRPADAPVAGLSAISVADQRNKMLLPMKITARYGPFAYEADQKRDAEPAKPPTCISNQLTCPREGGDSLISSFKALDLFKSHIFGIICPVRLLQDKIRDFLFPTFNNLSLFMIGLSFLLVFLFNESVRSGLYKIMREPRKAHTIIVLLLFAAGGLVLSLLHVFTKRQKSKIEKYAMLCFAIVTNAVCGILASLHILGISPDDPRAFSILHIWDVLNSEDGPSVFYRIFLILPVWNILNCVFLLLSLRAGLIDERNISDEQAGRMEVLLGFIVTGCIFVLCQFLFKLYWAITFSICVIYATSFGDTLGSVFHPERMQAAEANYALEEKVRPADKSEMCGFCGRKISPPETPYVINRRLIVCKQCHDKIKSRT